MLNFSNNLESIVGNISKNIPNISTSSSETEIDTTRLKKLMNLINKQDIIDFISAFDAKYTEPDSDENNNYFFS